MPEETDVFLSLGSNAGDRLKNLKEAISKLDSHPRLAVLSVSPVYQTEPLYNPNQADFYNCAVRIKTDLAPGELHRNSLGIEEQMGRIRTSRKNSSRLIDIDIIFFGKQKVMTPGLTVPHSRYAERNFVLVPLSDIAPKFVCPDTGLTVKQTLALNKDDSRIEVLTVPEMA